MTALDKRELGRGGRQVLSLGLGCMGLSGSYGQVDTGQAEDVIEAAILAGVGLLDTADFYGRGLNEELVGRVLSRAGNTVAVATKTGIGIGPDRRPIVNGRPEQLAAACDASLKRLGVETIDLYLLARVDTAVPIEDSVGAMADLVAQGKVRQIGLSEASAATIRRAHAIHPLAVVESEYSLAERGVEAEVLPTLRDLGITLVAYSPFGRGLLSGGLGASPQFDEGDFRRFNPRFSAENFGPNMARAAYLAQLADTLDLTPAQLALAWLLAQGKDILPIFGTRSPARLRSNLAAAKLSLPTTVMRDLTVGFPPGWAKGARYPEHLMALIDA